MCLPAEELTLEGFAQNGRSDTMAPGALLATVLDAVVGEGGSGLAALADDQLIGVISAARRMESRTAWTLMAALAELARRRPASGDPGDRGQYGFSEFAPDEVAAELRLSVQSAAGQMMYAVAVAGRLPRSFAALAAGQIHPVHLRIIDDETRILSPGAGRGGRRDPGGEGPVPDVRGAAVRGAPAGPQAGPGRGPAPQGGCGQARGGGAPVPGGIRERGDDRPGAALR